jgi:hypothetical protein
MAWEDSRFLVDHQHNSSTFNLAERKKMMYDETLMVVKKRVTKSKRNKITKSSMSSIIEKM